MEALTIQVYRDELETMRRALATEARLIGSYINKTREQQVRLLEISDLQNKIDNIISTSIPLNK